MMYFQDDFWDEYFKALQAEYPAYPLPDKWFTLRPKNWKWWYRFIPAKRKELKYYKIVEEIVRQEISDNGEKFQKHMLNVTVYGQCAGECGYDVIHGITPKGSE